MAKIPLNQSLNTGSAAFQEISKDIQGNILSSHGRDHAAHIFIKFASPVEGKKFLKRKIGSKVVSAEQQKINSDAFKANRRKRFRTFYSVSISKFGYDFLGIPSGDQPSDSIFASGQKNQSPSLQDPPVANWEVGLQDDWHAIIIVANTSKKILNRRINGIVGLSDLNVIASKHIERGQGIRNAQGAHIEHFGYVDGISQPALLTDNLDNGKVSTNNWNPQANLDIALVEDKGGTTDNSYGSYLIFRKLEQNVQAFKTAESSLASTIGVSVDVAGAQMVGRFRSGTPMIPVAPPQPGPSAKMNDFDYGDDTPKASKCPFHAHIRKTNPRGSGGFESLSDEKRHLFPRRGITFGDDPSSFTAPPSGGVGLLFMAYNSDIDNQFEFMQRTWANNTTFPGNKPNGPHGIDAIIGQGQDPGGQNYFSSWGDDNSEQRVTPSIGHFVTMKGGEYFFTPSISFLKSL